MSTIKSITLKLSEQDAIRDAFAAEDGDPIEVINRIVRTRITRYAVDVMERLERAEWLLDDIADNQDLDTTEYRRVKAKATGVALARSYVDETLR